MKETQISIFQMVFKLKISAYLTTKLMHAYQNDIYIVSDTPNGFIQISPLEVHSIEFWGQFKPVEQICPSVLKSFPHSMLLGHLILAAYFEVHYAQEP